MLWNKFCPLETTFVLQEEGEDISYYWKLKAPTFRDEQRVSQELRGKEDADVFDIALVELSAIFGGSNFPASDSPTFDPNSPDYVRALPDDASEQAVREYLNTLPSAIVYRLWEKVKEVSPSWGPSRFPGDNRS